MSMFGVQRDGIAHGWRRRQPIADINVTPFIDVMLVLLIIFMVAAPLLVSGVPVDLPNAQAKPLPQDTTPIQITINREGRIFLDRTPFAREAFVAKLSALREARSDEARVYVRADASLPYGKVMVIVADVTAAGFRKVALVTNKK